MKAEAGGWWQVEMDDAGHGTRYQFQLPGEPRPYPDPRSLWQPDGVHAASRVYDHARYQWGDHAWSTIPISKAVIYELHVGTFTAAGTFAGVETRLDELVDLGVTHVELMPVNGFPGRFGWGYDGVDLFAPQEAYGGPDGLKHLVDACHQAGLAVLLDVVYNHFGPVGNYTGAFGPYIQPHHHTPWGGAINFDGPGSEEVRRFFADNALMWLRDYHLDGLRLDAVNCFVDQSETHFLKQLSTEVAELSRVTGQPRILIAESDTNDPRIVTSSELEAAGRGYGIDAQWSDDFHRSVFAFFTGERQSYYQDFGSLAHIAKSLKSAYVIDGQFSRYRNQHHGQPIGDLGAHRFLGYVQNHDQVGNRARGDRLHSIVGERKARLAAAMVLTSPFVPMLFQGEEFAASSPFLFFADHDDPKLARDVAEGRRREHDYDGTWEGVPDVEPEEAFKRSKLLWQERDQPANRRMLRWYGELIALRMREAELRDDDLSHLETMFDEGEQWLRVSRGDARSKIQLFFNFSVELRTFSVPSGSTFLIGSEEGVELQDELVKLPAESFAAVRIKARSRE